ncbi:MAG: hypothetical protein JSS76_00870 [Bacteroidetes bacterium]|nr:hypothetical protein [Bacteroidota bacterium]MBS1683275.1 hypothetical protein [Bacteroidota bacterium]
MKYLFILFSLIAVIGLSAQQKPIARVSPLPAPLYKGLADSCTGIDVTFFTSSASMSLDNRNVRFFANFVSPYPANKNPNVKQDGIIMWTRNGAEYLTGKIYFSGDSSGYLIFEKNNREYVNAFSPQGAAFLQTHGKK